MGDSDQHGTIKISIGDEYPSAWSRDDERNTVSVQLCCKSWEECSLASTKLII